MIQMKLVRAIVFSPYHSNLAQPNRDAHHEIGLRIRRTSRLVKFLREFDCHTPLTEITLIQAITSDMSPFARELRRETTTSADHGNY